MILPRPASGVLVAIAGLALASCGDGGASAAPTRTPTAPATITRAATATSTGTATPTASASASPTPSSPPAVSATPSGTPTVSPTPSSTPTESPTATATENLLRLPALHAAPDAAGGGRIGAPVLIGEWGADPRSASDPTYTYFLDHQALQDQFFVGATLWTWHESCGDPHKQADYRAGRIPSVWGEFEVDCTTNTITGLRDDVIHQLTRAYVRAAPGHLLESSFTNATGAFAAHGTGASAGDELFAFYPASLHGTPVLTVSGLTDLQQIPAPGNNQYIVARAVGGDWSLATQ